MNTFLFIVTFLLCLLEGIPLIKRRMRKELITAGFIFLTAVIIQISKDLGSITIISFIETIFRPIGKMFLYHL